MRRILISHWGSPKNTISEIEAREKKERFENFWQFFSIYWWMIFPIFGFITWFISFFNSL